MANNSLNYLKQFYDRTRGMGRKAISSDFTIEIEGFEHLYLLTKQCPWPESSSAGEIEVATPLGATQWERQQQKVAMQGPLAFYETTQHTIDKALVDIIAKSGEDGGWFNAKIYHGVPSKHIGGKRIIDCFFVADSPDTDWENRSQVLMVSGTLFFHYFGELIPANSNVI